MNTKKILGQMVLFTCVCLIISYLSGRLGTHEESRHFPFSVFSAFAEKQDANLTEVHLKKTWPALKVRTVILKTTATDVAVQFDEGAKISANLEGYFPVENAKADLAWSVTEGSEALTVETNETDVHADSAFHFNLKSKDKNGKLKLNLPRSIESLTVETVSGEAKITGHELGTLVSKSVSGDLGASFVKLKNFERKTVSGETKLIGAAEHVAGTSVSGDLEIEFKSESPRVEINSTSGNVKLYFTQKPNASLQYSSVSGQSKIDTAFGELSSGKGQIKVKTVSGDVSVGSKPAR